MNRLFKLLGNKSKFTVKFSQEMNSYVVIKKDQGILYAGPKEQCNFFVQQHS